MTRNEAIALLKKKLSDMTNDERSKLKLAVKIAGQIKVNR